MQKIIYIVDFFNGLLFHMTQVTNKSNTKINNTNYRFHIRMNHITCYKQEFAHHRFSFFQFGIHYSNFIRQ